MKYELTDETKTAEYGVVLHRIRALREIPRWGVIPGDLGGWIENDYNLSQYGDAWVGGNAVISGDAEVYDDAAVGGNAQVYGDARVFGKAQVFGNAQVGDDAQVSGNAEVFGNAHVSGGAEVKGDSRVYGDARVSGIARVCEKAWILGKAWVFGNAQVSGNARICGEAVVGSSADYTVFKNTWSSYRWFTYTRSNRMWMVGCFYGTGEELVEKAYADSDRSGRCYEAIVRAVEAIESATAKEGGKK